MNDKDAFALLACAVSLTERKEAVATAMKAGIPLSQIEEFLDWAEAIRARGVSSPVSKSSSTSIASAVRTASIHARSNG
jgi:hypothetical protein